MIWYGYCEEGNPPQKDVKFLAQCMTQAQIMLMAFKAMAITMLTIEYLTVSEFFLGTKQLTKFVTINYFSVTTSPHPQN